MSNIEARQHDIRHLRDDELDTVSGAEKKVGPTVTALLKAMGELANQQAQKLKN